MQKSPSFRWLRLDLAAILITAGVIGNWFYWVRPGAPDPSLRPPNVVFIVLDTVRADHLSLCGYERPTSPNLDAFVASSGAQYTCDAQAPATWTLPSHASFFTGVHPSVHRSHAITSGIEDLSGIRANSRTLDKALPTLGEQMIEMGYDTRMVSSNPVVGSKLGLRRGFQKLRSAKKWGRMFDDEYLPSLKKLMRTIEPDNPTLLFLK